jgi:hypothetical protein
MSGSRAVRDQLPSIDELARLSTSERHKYLDRERRELHAVAAVMADQTMHRAREQRGDYPPYGLVRSLFTQLRAVADDPLPYEEGSIDGFLALGRAVVDTLVFHLERELAAMRHGDQAAKVGRLDQLLALFRLDAGATGQSRMRDPFSFLYGGLHFGVSVSIEMVEVMTRILSGGDYMTAGEKRAIIQGSVRAVYHLAALNLEDVAAAYARLHTGPDHPSRSGPWLSAEMFVVVASEGELPRIDLRVSQLGAIRAPAGNGKRYKTRGCPARNPVADGPGAIAEPWAWAVELAVATGLITDG